MAALEDSALSREYTIKIIPDGKGDTHTIRVPASWLKHGALVLAALALVFVGVFGYAVYQLAGARNSAAEIDELRQVNAIQQEQLLQLAKKANALQDEMGQLSQRESELRRLSGTATTADGAGDGQGGPYPYAAAEVGSIGAALASLEQGVAMRQASLDNLQRQIKANREQLAIALPAMGSAALAANIPSIWPAKGEVSSPFGLRWNGTDFHPGMDIANEFGTPIVATADGIVLVAGWNAGGYGNMVDIDHGGGITTRYGHAQQVAVAAGQAVRRGQIIAYMGSTGFSTGPHVHYEVSVDGQRVNPVNYLH